MIAYTLHVLLADARGVTSVEYAVIGTLIVLVCIAAITTTGLAVNGAFTSMANAF